ncbi:SF3a splicing factor complex subunit, partial [Teratosphaeriaceae sp. CCFEE 6253]
AGRGNLISAGREGEAANGGGPQTGVSGKGREERVGPEAPAEFAFSARMPNISAQDLEIVKLTALFAAKNGRTWMTTLSQREAGNYQFDFLRPQHSLYQFFTRLVDQYTALLGGDSLDSGRPQKKRVAELEANVADRFRVLERARKRAEWVRWQAAQKVAAEEESEKEKVAFAQIDWHDFVVVETVVFDERDEEAQLPAPTTLNDLQSASLEQK